MITNREVIMNLKKVSAIFKKNKRSRWTNLFMSNCKIDEENVSELSEIMDER